MGNPNAGLISNGFDMQYAPIIHYSLSLRVSIHPLAGSVWGLGGKGKLGGGGHVKMGLVVLLALVGLRTQTQNAWFFLNAKDLNANPGPEESR